MRHTSLWIVPLTLSVAACGADKGAPSTGSPPTSTSTDAVEFTPPAVSAGFTRLEPKTLKAIEPGVDVTKCEYAMAPFDRDMDVMDVMGRQSKVGHHIVAFAYAPPEGLAVGDSVECGMGTEFTSGADATAGSAVGGAFLGGASPLEGAETKLPEGVGFRLEKGQGVLLNMHYINTTVNPADGAAYLDLKLEEVDPTRPIASLFINFNGSFNVAPSAQGDSSVDCAVGSEVRLVMATNHMHEYGTHAITQVTRAAGGTVETVHEDPTWTEDMANNPTYSRWTVDEPLVLHAGDALRTSCYWDNTTTNAMTFPREMCVGVGFALTTGTSTKVPACFNGTWVDSGL
jgi:hypothetical protein